MTLVAPGTEVDTFCGCDIQIGTVGKSNGM